MVCTIFSDVLSQEVDLLSKANSQVWTHLNYNVGKLIEKNDISGTLLFSLLCISCPHPKKLQFFYKTVQFFSLFFF